MEGTPEVGHKHALAPAPAQASDEAAPVSVASLPLKESRKQQKQTPEPAQSPVQEVINDSQPASEVVARPSVSEDSYEGTHQRDALDDMIAEAKAICHLVSITQSLRESPVTNESDSRLIRSIPTRKPANPRASQNH